MPFNGEQKGPLPPTYIEKKKIHGLSASLNSHFSSIYCVGIIIVVVCVVKKRNSIVCNFLKGI